ILFKKLSGETFQAYPGTSRGTPGSLETAFEAGTTNTNIIYGGDATATSDIDESDTMTLEMLDDAKTCAEVGVIGSSTIYKIDPVMIKGNKFFCCVMHPYQWNSLKKTTDWKELMYQAEVRGKQNPVFTGATGYYNGIFIYIHDLVRTASTWGAGSDVAGATALFLGASAGLYAKAQKNPDWVEQKFNYGKKLGVGTGYIMGFDKATFNSLDHAVIAIKTAAKNPRV
ncbi:MAG: N4-gp56 family major capsid protein, partial [Candidatus Zixiibacteriota bacterium]